LASKEAFCEPDLFIVARDAVLLVEIKLTGNIEATVQMFGLYAPLLEFIYGRPCRGLQICKWANEATPGPFHKSIEHFISSGDRCGTWNWRP
jgi:hypothetical protein